MKDIYVLGSLNIDMTIESPQVPKQGETITGQNFFMNPGGKGANQAIACARAGGRTLFCGRIGSDMFGKIVHNSLLEAHVDCTCLFETENVSTGVAVILVVEENNRIIVDSGANSTLTESDVESFLSNAKQGDILLVQAEIPLTVLRKAMMLAVHYKMKILFNPAPAIKELNELIPYCDVILPNETELAILSGKDNISEGAEFLGENEVDVVVTLGENGCYFRPKGSVGTFYPCKKVKTVDTTAAGDTFCGYLAVKLAENASMENAINFAQKAASLSVTQRGAQASIPYRYMLEDE